MVNAVQTIMQEVQSLLAKHMHSLALDLVEKGVEDFPESLELVSLHAQVASESRDFYTSALLYEELVDQKPVHPKILIDAAVAWSRLGDFKKAIEYCNCAIQFSNSSVRSVLALADIYERSNLADEAIALLGTIPDQKDNGNFQRLKARLLISKKQYSDSVDYLLSLVASEQNCAKKTKLFFLLSKAYDRLGEFDLCWEAATNAHDFDDTHFDEQAFFSQFEQMRSFMTKDTIQSLIHGPSTEVKPVFIVANPRSGTSLLEQILGMHSGVENGGEMPTGSLLQSSVAKLTDSFHQWPMNIIDLRSNDINELSLRYIKHCDFFRNDATVVSNKALNLHLQLGFLSQILPSSRAIFLHRNPLDNAVSCFTNNLLAAGLPYTNKLEHIGRTWVERKKITDHWLEALSIPMMELHYEDLVTGQRKQTERLIEFLDLPWQEDCMEFHKSDRVARTISYDQVNKKMYNTSSGRWKNYEMHLGPLIDVVHDYI